MQRQCGEGSMGWGVGGDYLLLTYLVSYFLCDAVQESSISVVKGEDEEDYLFPDSPGVSLPV